MVCFNFVLCIGAMGCAPIWECWWPVLLMATYSSSECSKGLCRKREYTTCSRQSPHISVMGRCRTSQYLASPGKMLKEAKCLEFAAQAMGLFISLTMGAIEFTEWTVQLEVAPVSVGTCLVSFFLPIQSLQLKCISGAYWCRNLGGLSFGSGWAVPGYIHTDGYSD